MAIEINNNQEKPKKMEVPPMENPVNPNVFKEKKPVKFYCTKDKNTTFPYRSYWRLK